MLLMLLLRPKLLLPPPRLPPLLMLLLKGVGRDRAGFERIRDETFDFIALVSAARFRDSVGTTLSADVSFESVHSPDTAGDCVCEYATRQCGEA
jgi:hypothetical protein